MQENKIQIIILCGGYGKRLWPLSSSHVPKQFMKLNNELSLFQKTILRAIEINIHIELVFVGNFNHRFLIKDQINEINLKNNYKIILEPCSQNTAASLTAAAFLANENQNHKLLVLSADHSIKYNTKFLKTLKSSLNKVSNDTDLFLFGITPTEPSVDFGYFEVEDSGKYPKKIKTFIEKPNLKKAQGLILNKNIYWNSGIFLLKAKTWLDKFKQFDKVNYSLIQSSWKHRIYDLDFIVLDNNYFSRVKNISIDYAVIENFQKLDLQLFAFKLDCGWSDLGSFKKIKEFFKSDKDHNLFIGESYSHESKNNFTYSHDKKIFIAGVENTLVVNTPECILIGNLNNIASVYNLYKEVQKKYPKMIENYHEEHRPWGSFRILAEGKNFKVKKIIIKPLSKLSYQSHKFRNEHWVVVSGYAELRLDKKLMRMDVDESMYIRKGVKHQLINNDSLNNLEIIEVQTGKKLLESDIIRHEDFYKRNKELT